MKNTVDIILLIVIACVGYLIFKSIYSRSTEKFKNVDEDIIFDDNSEDSDIDIDYVEQLKKLKKGNNSAKLNKHFLDTQFHNDYRDTITAFNNIAPNQKQLFNQVNLPVKFTLLKIGDKGNSEVNKLVKRFVIELNQNVMTEVPEHRNASSGWDELIPEKKVKSGWEKQQESLGLPTSIYNEPAKNGKVKIVKLDRIEKYETEDEIKYSCYVVLKKKNVTDQMCLRLSFVLDRKEVNIDRDMFKESDEIATQVVIEEIFIVGFYSDYGQDGQLENYKPDDFYNFEALNGADMIDQKTIVKELREKYKQRTKEMNSFNAMLDTEGANFHAEMPSRNEYDSLKVSRDIFDDVEGGETRYY
jgi:hypothetical protein